MSWCVCCSWLWGDADAGAGAGASGSTVEQCRFDDKAKGADVALGGAGTGVSGEGACIANAALHQDQCYWEVELVKLGADGAEGSFCIGLAHRKPEVVAKPLGDLEHSWCFDSTRSTEAFVAGDVIGCVFDQAYAQPTLTLRRNGEAMANAVVRDFRGTVHPAVSVSSGCELRCNFSIDAGGFKFPPPSGFSGLIPSRSLM